MEEASFLMDRPVGGWSELVTNHTLDLKFEVLDARFAAIDARFEAFDAKFDVFRAELLAQMHQEFRNQTWKLLTALVATMTMLIALFGVILAVVARS